MGWDSVGDYKGGSIQCGGQTQNQRINEDTKSRLTPIIPYLVGAFLRRILYRYLCRIYFCVPSSSAIQALSYRFVEEKIKQAKCREARVHRMYVSVQKYHPCMIHTLNLLNLMAVNIVVPGLAIQVKSKLMVHYK